MLMTLAQAHALLPGSALHGNPGTPLLRVHSDTRSLRAGDLFVALRGERFDGNNCLPQAFAAGAAAALVDRLPASTADFTGLLVPDSLVALQQLATAWRAHLHLPLVAVAGSNGKTTVTQMLASIFKAWQGSGALATAGNLNNHIGVPLTLLRLRQDDTTWHRAAVLELGMNHVGEIAQLARMCAPTVAVVNNAQREHLEFMATVEAVAQENGSVISALPHSGVAVLPQASDYLPLWRGLAGQRQVLTFGLDASADVHATATWVVGPQPHWHLQLNTPAGSVTTALHQPGQHNVMNALAAAAGALAAGAPLAAVAQGLAAFVPVAGRSQALALQWRGQAITLVDDSYNANPDSVLAAIQVLASMPGPRWLLLGDMGEVGSQGPQFHAEVGEQARASGIEHVWAVGALCAHTKATRHFGTVRDALHAMADAPNAASVLIKGSRFMKMEQLVQALQAAADKTADRGAHAV
jgi:UDP-N-acetylmuramoyl-tripeptide--D-alanyl-D-alanine ligase